MPNYREPHCLSLPPEIWIRILSYHSDLTHLWTTCRLISRTFLAYTEQVFAEYHLRNTFIDFPLEKYNLGGKSRRPEVSVSYAHFLPKDRDKKMVYFKDKRKKSEVGGKAEFERVMERWGEKVSSSKPEMPNYTIRIAGMVNDTKLPGLVFNVKERGIGFRWREMFTSFFREQQRLRELKRRWQMESAKKLENNRIRLAKGEKLSVDDLPKSWATTEVELRKQIRRARILECYQDNEEMIWALGSLKHFENYSSTATFKLLPDIPGAGVGEKWFGSMHLLQGLYLDEWSCMHRIEMKSENLAQGTRK